MHQLAEDIRYALRQLRRSPGFALLALLTLTLGVGANVIDFGVMDEMFVRPLSGLAEHQPSYTGSWRFGRPELVWVRRLVRSQFGVTKLAEITSTCWE